MKNEAIKRLEALERRLMTQSHHPIFEIKRELLECIKIVKQLKD